MKDTLKIPNNLLYAQNDFPQFIAQDRWQLFLSTELGEIYQVIPWEELVRSISRKMPHKHTCGVKAHLNLRAQIALMFLKVHLNVSDGKLIERLNCDFSLQYFCNIHIAPHKSIKDSSLPSKIRKELSNYIDYEAFQKILAGSWAEDLDHKDISMQDATCYETSMRYPTDVKILFESAQYLEKYMTKLCKKIKHPKPRNKYKKQKLLTIDYLKQRRKTHKQTKRRVKYLLKLVHKQIVQMDELIHNNREVSIGGRFSQRYPLIKKVTEQRQSWQDTGQKPKDLIVSIDKPYIRPIVRGKENKRVEFGAKVNMLQVDGINFIEHLSFDAFHEGNRLQNGIHLHRKLFGRCSVIAADQIYATNANRKYCTKSSIKTNFKPKGRPSRHKTQQKQLQNILNLQRSTTLEGSFGVEKEIYGLKKIRARTKETEILWIYFAVHYRNASVIAKKRQQKRQQLQKEAMQSKVA